MPITISSATIDREFIDKVAEISGEPIRKCMQCGTCSAVCPMDASAVTTPRSLIHMTLLGQKQSAIEADFAWMCVSCHECMVRCPRDLDVAKIIEAVRLVLLRTNVNLVEPNKLDPEKIKDFPQIAMVSSFRKHTA